MKLVWTKHLTDEKEKQRFENEVRNSRTILDRLSDIITELEQGLEDQELNPKAYDSPNWAYRQAHANGVKSGLRKVKTLLNPDQGQKES